MIEAGSSSSLQYAVDNHGDLAYYNENGLTDDIRVSGWVHVFPTDDSLQAKTPKKKAKPRQEGKPINKGMGEIVKIQSTPGDFVLAGLAEANELLVVYHPSQARGMASEALSHSWSKFNFDGCLVNFCGSPTNVICMVKVEEDDEKLEPAGRTLFGDNKAGCKEESTEKDHDNTSAELEFEANAGKGGFAKELEASGDDFSDGSEVKATAEKGEGGDSEEQDSSSGEFYDSVQPTDTGTARRGPLSKSEKMAEKLARVKAQWAKSKKN